MTKDELGGKVMTKATVYAYRKIDKKLEDKHSKVKRSE